MGTIRKIENTGLPLPKIQRVAAYCRVSRDTERLLHSFSAQVSYYSTLIQKNPEWEYAGVYADEGITGTSTDSRDEFNRLIADCEAGLIDIVLTKSISRFARNTVDLLETVRRLKALGVEVRFEEQNISTLSGDGELMLTILASFAQEESISQSNNICWAKRKTMEAGEMTNTAVPYGYRYDPDTRMPEVVSEQAEIIRDIFRWYLEDDQSVYTISKRLNAAGIPSPRGAAWTQAVVRRMLRNETYTGNMMLGKFYSDGPLTQRHTKNYGERPMYFAEETHEAIISMETFRKVQDRMAYNSAYGCFRGGTRNCFTGKIICGVCGQTFGRATIKREKGKKYPSWTCKKHAGEKAKCRVVTVLEQELETISAELLGTDAFSPAVFEEQIENITVTADDHLLFRFRDGRIIDRYYPRRRKLRSEGKQNG
jgi:site-specific DNA recombinase